MRLLNASGCLDALTAPEVARTLDAFVTKTVTPLPREGNAPVRIAETELGMLNSIGLANPGVDALPRRAPAAARRARRAALGLGRRLLGRGLRARRRAARRARRGRGARAEPLVPERRRGARERRRGRRRRPGGHRPSRSTRSSRPPSPTSARPRGPRRRPAPTGSPSSTRSAASRSTSGRCSRCSRAGPAASRDRRCGRSRSPRSTPASARRACRSSAWAASARGRHALELLAAGASDVALGTVLFADPGAPTRIRDELEAEVAALGFASPDNVVGVAHASADSTLDPRSRVGAKKSLHIGANMAG